MVNDGQSNVAVDGHFYIRVGRFSARLACVALGSCSVVEKNRLLREIAIFFLAKNLRVKSLIKSILQNSVNFAPLISVIIIYFMTLK